MSLESKIKSLADKYDQKARKEHDLAESYYNNGKFEMATGWDHHAHVYEAVAIELRMALKHDH